MRSEVRFPECLPFFFVYRFFSSLILGTLCGFTTGYLDLIDYYYTKLLYDVRVCICIYLSCISAAAAPCVAILLLLPLQCYCLLLLLVIVCRVTLFVPVVYLLHLIPVFSFSSFKHDLFFMYPLAVLLSHVQPRFTYNTYHTSSVITGMRGAKAGVNPSCN